MYKLSDETIEFNNKEIKKIIHSLFTDLIFFYTFFKYEYFCL